MLFKKIKSLENQDLMNFHVGEHSKVPSGWCTQIGHGSSVSTSYTLPYASFPSGCS